MKVLIIGSGAREHTLAWKIAQSEKVKKIYAAPGNGGMAEIAECVDIKPDDIEQLLEFAKQNAVDLTVVGPEQPLVLGIVDKFNTAGLKIFGPNSKGARLEGSKAYSKRFMKRYSIPTAKYEVFYKPQEAKKALDNFDFPLVVKADGLAGGKGAIICQNREESEKAINQLMIEKSFGAAGSQVVIEEYLSGIEASLLCFVSGTKIIQMESARDYKKALDGDKGLNTGGMGCFSPNPVFTPELNQFIQSRILNNTIVGLNKENINFRGVLFIGLMIKDNEAKVLEYNVRFGDPEAEVIIPRLENDLVSIIEKTINGNITKNDLTWSPRKSLCVIAASGGYPESYQKGEKITGLNNLDKDIMVFHGGTKKAGEETITSGGRVLAITALGNTLEEARKKVYENIEKIAFEKIFYRKDIGKL